jgi:hypothetical protein
MSFRIGRGRFAPVLARLESGRPTRVEDSSLDQRSGFNPVPGRAGRSIVIPALNESLTKVRPTDPSWVRGLRLESQDKSFIISRKRIILSSMNEKEIQARFEEIQNELEAQRAQLAAFKEDLKILLRHRSIACRDIVETAQQLGNSAFDQSDVQKCEEFLKKYGVRKGF